MQTESDLREIDFVKHVSGNPVQKLKGPRGVSCQPFCDLYLSPSLTLVERKMTEQPPHSRATYNEIHKLIRESAKRIVGFRPNLFIAIGLPEFVPPYTHG